MIMVTHGSINRLVYYLLRGRLNPSHLLNVGNALRMDGTQPA